MPAFRSVVSSQIGASRRSFDQEVWNLDGPGSLAYRLADGQEV
jgi:hypothetical protein